MLYSPTKLKTYLKCPRKYKFLYIDNMVRMPLDYLERGTAIHEAIAKDDIKLVANDFGDYIMYNNSRLYIEDKFGKNVKFEVKLGINSNLEPADFNTAWFRCIIDILYEISPNKYGIIDWKTGYSKSDIAQLLLNAIVAEANGYHIVTIGYIYLRNFTEQIIPFTDNSREHAKKLLFDTINMIENDTEFAPNVSSNCYYCDFNQECSDLLSNSPEEDLARYIILESELKRLWNNMKEYINITGKEIEYGNYKFCKKEEGKRARYKIIKEGDE